MPAAMLRESRFPGGWALHLPLLLAAVLVALSSAHFLWFHALAEMFAIIAGVTLYLVARASFDFNRNRFLLFLAQGFFWAACLDVLHTLSYKGMGLIPGDDANPATQLWIVARFLEASTLLLAPRYLVNAQERDYSFWIMGALSALAAGLIFSGHFPAAFIEGVGLTPFKIVVEYAIILVLLGAAWHLHLRRVRLDAGLYRLLLGIIALTIVSEFAFTLYVSAYGLSNLVGHIFKFWAFWLLMLAVFRWMLAEPFRAMARDARSFDHIPIPVLLLDADGTIQVANPRALDERPEGMPGRHMHEAWAPADLDRADCPVCRAIETGQAYEGEVRDSGRDTWHAVHLQPIRRQGRVAGYVCAQVNLTGRKRAEARLVQSEKMELIGQMSGGLAHDFNNLLGVILGSLELLARDVVDERSRRQLDLAQRAARRASEVTRSLLAVARKQALTPTRMNLRDAVADAMPLIRQAVGRAVVVHENHCARCEQGDLYVEVDMAGLGSALLNLAVNARDAMPEGGQLTVSSQVRDVTQEEAGMPADLKPGHYAVLSVSDTGHGMTPEVAAKVFEPFFTTKAQGKGTGLGMAMVYGFARQSGGTVTLYSQPGVGTTVRLYLPVELAGVDEPAVRVLPLPNGVGERILLVDDEDALREIGLAWLTDLGYRVTGAAGPDEALVLLAGQPFDLLVSDISMPGTMDGQELASRAVAARPGLRVLLMSGFAGDAGQERWRRLPKPFSRADLATAVRTVLTTPY